MLNWIVHRSHFISSRLSEAHAVAAFALLVAGLLLSGCDTRAPSNEESAAPVAEMHKPKLWKRIHDATIVEVGHHDTDLQRRLAAATQQALSTLDDARQRWNIAKPGERALWAIKWAAPLAPASLPAEPDADTAAPAVEHVWVRPVNWSPFRIEGILLSQPTATLDCGRHAGGIVSFPSEETTDWLHFASAEDDAAFEGGFTLIVLEERFGPPGAPVTGSSTSPADN